MRNNRYHKNKSRYHLQTYHEKDIADYYPGKIVLNSNKETGNYNEGINRMVVIVDEDACVGCEMCTETCPEVFEMDGDKSSVKVNEVPGNAEDDCKQAAEECPVEAISVSVESMTGKKEQTYLVDKPNKEVLRPISIFRELPKKEKLKLEKYRIRCIHDSATVEKIRKHFHLQSNKKQELYGNDKRVTSNILYDKDIFKTSKLPKKTKKADISQINKTPKKTTKKAVENLRTDVRGKFKNIETYMAMFRIGNAVYESNIGLDKTIMRELVSGFLGAIETKLKNYTPNQAYKWFETVSLKPFDDYMKPNDWERFFYLFIDSVKNVIELSKQSNINEQKAFDWLKFIYKAKEFINDTIYRNIIIACFTGIEGKTISPQLAEASCKTLRKTAKTLTTGINIFDALTLLELPCKDNIWTKDYFRQTALSCLLDGYSIENIQNCMTKIKNEIMHDHKLFETWGIVYVELRNSGIKFDS